MFRAPLHMPTVDVATVVMLLWLNSAPTGMRGHPAMDKPRALVSIEVSRLATT